MTALESTIDIRRQPDQVYAYITDPTRWGEWQPDVVAAQVLDAGPQAPGTRITTTRRIGRAERTMTQQVTTIEPPTRWAVHGVDGPLRPSMDVTVEPLPDGAGTRVTFALGFEGRGFADLLVPVVRRMAARTAPSSYRRLKNRLEALGSAID